MQRKVTLFGQGAALACLLFTAKSAWANGAPPQAPGSEVQSLLSAIPKQREVQKATQTSTEQAKKARARAKAMRHADDLEHASMMDAVALEWAQVARDIAAAMELERLLTETGQRLSSMQETLKRARLLLEETHARKARATRQLKELRSVEGSP